MLYISIRQDVETNSTVTYILCDDCIEIPVESEIERQPVDCPEECEICLAIE